MTQKIIGLDVGAYSVKALLIDTRKRGAVLQLLEQRIPAPQAPAPQIAPAPPAPDALDAVLNDAVLDDAIEDASALDADAAPAPVSDVAPTPDWARVASDMLVALRAEGDLIGVPMPAHQAMTLQLPSPFPDRSKLAKILPGMLMDRMPLPLDEVTHDFTVRPDGHGGNVAVVGFGRIADVSALIDALRAVNLDPNCILVPELVLEQTARAVLPTSGTTALLDLGHSGARLVIWHEGRAALSRTMHVGGQHLTAKIAEVFQSSLEDAERVKLAHAAILTPGEEQDASRAALSRALVDGLAPLVRDLRRSLQSLYAKERVEVGQLLLTGGSSRITGLCEHLTEALGIPTARLGADALGRADGPEIPFEAREAIAQRGLVALGVALSIQSVSARAQTVNLRQGKLAYRGSSPFMRAQLTRLVAAAAVLFVLLLGALGMQYKDRAAQRDAMRAAVIAESKKLFGQPVYTKADVAKRVAGNTAAQTTVAPKMSAYALLFELSDKADPEMKLDLSRVEVDVTRALIQIYGSTSDPQAVDKLVTDLENIKCLKDIKKDKLQVKSEEEASFELQINSGGCS
jgi:type IV pilus assembly protein PilM